MVCHHGGRGSDPRAVRGRTAVDRVALEHVLPCSPVSTIVPVLYTHSFISHRRCETLATDGLFK